MVLGIVASIMRCRDQGFRLIGFRVRGLGIGLLGSSGQCPRRRVQGFGMYRVAIKFQVRGSGFRVTSTWFSLPHANCLSDDLVRGTFRPPRMAFFAEHPCRNHDDIHPLCVWFPTASMPKP